ncbi:hypothetical protein OF117_07580 [Geodermatophilus sp. YIM 151500]|uniref:hypothetical protein n=1 Tax=Geodermatophilus sp. YIM 151500 TaxID=2984531 RepID=UPI0021E3A203|nr:hypothetical protein [Geodermatophilus sp. YIM 151500]MCV2489222.1 hypothetical protein [Geodermatophilus sp. YIM 151500]
MTDGLADRRRRQERAYEFERWARPVESRTAATVLVAFQPCVPAGFSLAGANDYPDRLHAERVRRYFIAQKGRRTTGGLVVEIVAAECDSSVDARASVMDLLATQMVNMLQPAEPPDFGDVCFTSSRNDPACVLFARGTVAVLVRSVGSIAVGVEEFARCCDEQLRGRTNR